MSRKKQSNSVTVSVTPRLAAEMLERNINNRTVRERTVEEYALNMRLGRWMPVGEIIFDREGNLLDGQHRLMAVLRADVPVELRVTRNADPSVRYVIDTGIKRTNGDALKMRGVLNSSAAASTARLLQIYAERLPTSQFTPLTTQEYALKHDHEIQRSLPFGQRLRRTISNANQSVFAAAHVMFSRKDSAAADTFFEQLILGNNLDKGNPILALRNSLMVGHRGTHVVRDQMESAVRTWNHYRTGGQISRVLCNGTIPEAM